MRSPRRAAVAAAARSVGPAKRTQTRKEVSRGVLGTRPPAADRATPYRIEGSSWSQSMGRRAALRVAQSRGPAAATLQSPRVAGSRLPARRLRARLPLLPNRVTKRAASQGELNLRHCRPMRTILASTFSRRHIVQPLRRTSRHRATISQGASLCLSLRVRTLEPRLRFGVSGRCTEGGSSGARGRRRDVGSAPAVRWVRIGSRLLGVWNE